MPMSCSDPSSSPRAPLTERKLCAFSEVGTEDKLKSLELTSLPSNTHFWQAESESRQRVKNTFGEVKSLFVWGRGPWIRDVATRILTFRDLNETVTQNAQTKFVWKFGLKVTCLFSKLSPFKPHMLPFRTQTDKQKNSPGAVIYQGSCANFRCWFLQQNCANHCVVLLFRESGVRKNH